MGWFSIVLAFNLSVYLLSFILVVYGCLRDDGHIVFGPSRQPTFDYFSQPILGHVRIIQYSSWIHY